MRNVILLDTKIDKDEALTVLEEYGEWYEELTGIPVTFWVERRDFSQVPTVPDSDGDLKPTYKFRQSLAGDVHSRYGDYGTDNIVMLVHEDNFVFKGVWGVNWSYVHYKYSFQLCRWDKDNPANTFGTINHEQDHTYDTLIEKEINIDVRPILGVDNYDADTTHGRHPDFEYINYKQNADKLKTLATYLQRAYNARKQKHQKYTDSLMKTVILIASQLIELLRLWKSKEDSIPKK